MHKSQETMNSYASQNATEKTTARTTPSTAEPTQSMSIQVLERATLLLDVLAREDEPMPLKNLALATGLHTSTTHRILNDLVIGRYVERVDSGLYRLGMRLLELGSLVKVRLNVRSVALEYMRELHKITGQTVNLALRQGDEIVYVERAWNEYSGMQVVRAIGGHAPLHLTSSGKLFLSAWGTRQVRAYVMRTGLAGSTRNSLTQYEDLDRELSIVRRHGYARDNEELELGVRCIAAGIYDESGELVAGLSVSAPADRLHDGWIPVLQDTARNISKALGFEPYRQNNKN